jgi:hypothetical protein
MVDALPGGQRSRARAAARMGFPSGSCGLSPDPAEVFAQFEAAQAAAGDAATAAQEAAQQAAAQAAAAFRDFVNAPPETRQALEQVADQAKEAAEQAADEATATTGELTAEPVAITADCGPVSLDLVLELPSPSSASGRCTAAGSASCSSRAGQHPPARTVGSWRCVRGSW